MDEFLTETAIEATTIAVKPKAGLTPGSEQAITVDTLTDKALSTLPADGIDDEPEPGSDILETILAGAKTDKQKTVAHWITLRYKAIKDKTKDERTVEEEQFMIDFKTDLPRLKKDVAKKGLPKLKEEVAKLGAATLEERARAKVPTKQSLIRFGVSTLTTINMLIEDLSITVDKAYKARYPESKLTCRMTGLTSAVLRHQDELEEIIDEILVENLETVKEYCTPTTRFMILYGGCILNVGIANNAGVELDHDRDPSEPKTFKPKFEE